MRETLAIIFLGLSFLGYSHFLRKDFSLNPSFIPFIIATSYIFVISLAARLSLMLFSIVSFNLLGLFLFIRGLKERKYFKDLFPKYFIIIISVLALAIGLRGRILMMYDDFSHWGTIARLLVEKDFINTHFDDVIDFKSYPQATAYFIYGVVRFLGFSESNMMVANSILTLSAGFTLTYLIKDRYIDYFLSLLGLAFIFLYNVRPYGLLVDTILPTVAFAALAFIGHEGFNEDKNRLKYFLIPIFVSLVYIKNSGLLFAFLIFAYVFIKYIKKDMSIVIISGLSIILAQLSWKNHIANNFMSAGRHSISLDSYTKRFYENQGLIREFSKSFIKNIGLDFFIRALVLSLIVLFFIKKDKYIIKILALGILVYGIYQLGNYLMYITSMDHGELRRLACFDRYTRTIHIFIGLSCLFFLGIKYKDSLAFRLVSCILFSFSIFILPSPEEIALEDEDFRREIIKERDLQKIKPASNILVKYESMDDTRILTRAVMFSLNTSRVTDTYIGDDKDFDKDDFDYYIDLTD